MFYQEMECAGERHPQGRVAPPRPPPPGSSAAQRGDVNMQTTAALQAYQKLHDKAYAAVQKGLNADEQGDLAAAERYYASCLPLLDEILAADCENLPGATPSEIDTAKQMQQKMNKTKLQISYRLESIQSESNNQMLAHSDTASSEESGGVRLPSYEEAVSSSSHSSLISDAALGDSIMSAEYPSVATGEHAAEGTALFSIPDGVQIFHITCEGFVSAPSYPTALHIVKFEEPMERIRGSQLAHDAPPAFIQVGDWFYPLVPGASPVLHTTFGAYLFPDLSPDGSGMQKCSENSLTINLTACMYHYQYVIVY